MIEQKNIPKAIRRRVNFNLAFKALLFSLSGFSVIVLLFMTFISDDFKTQIEQFPVSATAVSPASEFNSSAFQVFETSYGQFTMPVETASFEAVSDAKRLKSVPSDASAGLTVGTVVELYRTAENFDDVETNGLKVSFQGGTFSFEPFKEQLNVHTAVLFAAALIGFILIASASYNIMLIVWLKYQQRMPALTEIKIGDMMAGYSPHEKWLKAYKAFLFFITLTFANLIAFTLTMKDGNPPEVKVVIFLSTIGLISACSVSLPTRKIPGFLEVNLFKKLYRYPNLLHVHALIHAKKMLSSPKAKISSRLDAYVSKRAPLDVTDVLINDFDGTIGEFVEVCSEFSAK